MGDKTNFAANEYRATIKWSHLKDPEQISFKLLLIDRKGNKYNKYLGTVFLFKINESRTSVNFLALLNNKTILYSHRLIAKGIFDKVANSRG